MEDSKVKGLIHISKVKIYIGGRYITMEEIQQKARKENKNEEK